MKNEKDPTIIETVECYSEQSEYETNIEDENKSRNRKQTGEKRKQ